MATKIWKLESKWTNGYWLSNQGNLNFLPTVEVLEAGQALLKEE